MEERVKLSLFVDNILYVESPTESAKKKQQPPPPKTLELIKDFNTIVGYKNSIQKLVAFPYNSNKLSKKEIKEQFYL